MGKTGAAHVVDIGRGHNNSKDLELSNSSNVGEDKIREGNNNCNGDEGSTVVKSIQKALENMTSLPSNCSIYRVPEPLRKIKPEAYTPRMVSIGPFHRDKKHLKPMEAHKLRYLHDFLGRQSPAKLSNYVEAMVQLGDRARSCYSEIIQLEANEFAEMMLIDGCFILELVLRTNLNEPRRRDEPILNAKWMSHVIKCDLLLLENQLPFFVLERLYNLLIENSNVVNGAGPLTFSDHARFFFRDFVPPPQSNTSKSRLATKEQAEHEENSYDSHPKHLLDCVRALLLGLPSGTTERENCGQFVVTRCATELNEASVKFRKGPTNCVLDITFTDGVLRMPTMRIESWTESLFRNLIAFEQSDVAYTHDITHYTAFISGLIDTPKDVKLLQKQGIIENLCREPEEVAALLNGLLKEVTIVQGNYYFSTVCRGVDYHCKIPWHKWKASLMHSYFNTTSSFISFLAAVFLLILTVVQTICSIIQVT